MVAIVSIYESGLLRAFEEQGVRWGSKVAREVMDEAMIICPGRTGTLRRSHRVVQGHGVAGRFTSEFHVENFADHALYVHNGTGIYGPRGTPIFPVNTPKKKFMHVPPGMGFPWSLSTRLAAPRKRQKGVRGPYIRILDPNDPYGHAEKVWGDHAQPWLYEAGQIVSFRHGAR